jgi:hypothetical protein
MFEFYAAYPRPSFGRIHKQKHNNREEEEEKKKVSSLAISTPLQKNQAHGMYKRKSFGFSLFFRQCFLSHSAYDMVEEKRRKKTNME